MEIYRALAVLYPPAAAQHSGTAQLACSPGMQPSPRSLPQPVWKYVGWTLGESRSCQALLHLQRRARGLLGLVGEDMFGSLCGVLAWILLSVSRSLTLFHAPCHTCNQALIFHSELWVPARTPAPSPSPPVSSYHCFKPYVLICGLSTVPSREP